MKHLIKHPMADEISVLEGEVALCDEGQVEIAFFKDGEWVLEPVGPFSEYFYPSDRTAVYANVPRELVDLFLAAHSVDAPPEQTPFDKGELGPGKGLLVSIATEMMRDELSKKKRGEGD